MKLFSQTIADSVSHLTHMHVVLFYKFFIHRLHSWSFNHAYTYYIHAFTFAFAFTFSCLSASLGSLGPDSTSPRQHCAILRRNALSSSQEMHFCAQWLSSGLALCNPKGQWLFTQKISQCSHRACNHCQLRLCIVQSQRLETKLDFAFHNSSSQLASQQHRLCLVQSWKSTSRSPYRNYTTFLINHTCMLRVSSQVYFGFQLTDCFPWMLSCLQV